MLSLAMIRVEPGSTPGIGITICEVSFLPFSSFVGCFFAFCKVNWSHAAAVLEFFFDIATPDMHLVLGTIHYIIKSDNVDKEHGHTGGTYLIFPPSWPPLPTYLTIGMTENHVLSTHLPYPA